MTFQELIPMLAGLGFDCTQLPPVRGSVQLLEVQYDWFENGWFFRLAWEDMRIGVPPKELPQEVWDGIKEHVSPGNDDTMIYVWTKTVGWTSDSTVDEISAGLLAEIAALTGEAERVAQLIAPWAE